jgi:tripartite-type tricarboxylate transporter receptor subunit TctC
MLKKLCGAAFGALLVFTGALGGPAVAQNFPNHPMVMIIPFAAGGPQDVLGRIIAQGMSEALGQQVIIENVGGAGGMTGSVRVAQAAPDGYTMVLGSVGTHAQNQTLFKKPLYDAASDFTPVALVAETPIAALSSTQASWLAEPVPAEPYCILAWLTLA